MRHTPTTLYIDTQVFHGNQLRFDTSVYQKFKDVFVKEGIRLLVPEIMERELLRHFKRKSNEIVENLAKAHEEYHVRFLNLRELPTAENLKAECFNGMVDSWKGFQEHFTVEKLPLIGKIEDVVDWYFDVEPPFGAPKKLKEFPDAFILSVLDLYHEQNKTTIAVVSFDRDFKKACKSRSYIAYYEKLDEYIESFKPELSVDSIEREEIDSLRPVTTEDLTELKALLGRGSNVTQLEIDRVLKLLKARGTNYDYFFKYANDGIWLNHLKLKGYFDDPPDVIPTDNGGFRFPHWAPIKYLDRIYEQNSEGVLDILEELPRVSNPMILEFVLDIVLKSRSASTVSKLADQLFSFIENNKLGWGHEKINNLILEPYFFDKSLSDFSSSFLARIIEFLPDPKYEYKKKRYKENPREWGLSLNPQPRFDSWPYKQILTEGIRVLAEDRPLSVARLLVDAVSGVYRLSYYEQELEEEGFYDRSEFLCNRLDKESEFESREEEACLIRTLTYACECVLNSSEANVSALDQILCNQPWRVFKRLRAHLYSIRPITDSIHSIRDMITSYDQYGEKHYSYEFQKMVRVSSQAFKENLLPSDDLKRIVKLILDGPSKSDYLEIMGEQFSEELYLKYQKRFHYKQLRPFKSLLKGEDLDYFLMLEKEYEDTPIQDEDYLNDFEAKSGMVSYKSPYSFDELSELPDEKLLSLINEWDESHREGGDFFVEINIGALSGVFKRVFGECIFADSARFEFWKDNRDRIQRPVYVSVIVGFFEEQIKSETFDRLDDVLEFCEWILTHQDLKPEEDSLDADEVRDTPAWGRARRAVGDLVGECFSKELNTPIEYREKLFGLLNKICLEADWRLDSEQKVFLNENDQISEAINNTRSRGLENLARYGFWVRRSIKEAELSEILSVLEERLEGRSSPVLTLPERAMLGMNFGAFFTFDAEWAERNIHDFFPQSEFEMWVETFAAFLRYNRPYRPVFEILKGEYFFALKHCEKLKGITSGRRELLDLIGQNLFRYYLWEVFPLSGEDSLLDSFYKNTSIDREKWKSLFQHVGWLIGRDGMTLPDVQIERVKAYFLWRIESNDPLELESFTSWISVESLEPSLRLESYLKVLDVVSIEDSRTYRTFDVLESLVEQETALVTKSLLKLTEQFLECNGAPYINEGSCRYILEVAFDSGDEAVIEDARIAKDNLLQLRYDGFLDFD